MAATKSSRSKSNGSPDAIEMLMEDHARVKKLFKAFEKAKDGDDDKLTDIVTTACTELKIHSQIEKEIFYPAVEAKATGELKDLLAEAEVEHESIDLLVEKLSSVKMDDESYKANFTVVSEYVQHHVKEEEKEMFPLVRKQRGLDLNALAMSMKARQEELMSELAGDMPLAEGEMSAKASLAARGGKSQGQRGSRAAR